MLSRIGFDDSSYLIKSNFLIDIKSIEEIGENLKFDLINVCIENSNIENSILNLKTLCKNLDFSGRLFQISYACLLNNNIEAFNFIFEESDFSLNKNYFSTDEREKIQNAIDIYKSLETENNDTVNFIEEFLNKKQKDFLLLKLKNYTKKEEPNISKKRKM